MEVERRQSIVELIRNIWPPSGSDPGHDGKNTLDIVLDVEILMT